MLQKETKIKQIAINWSINADCHKKPEKQIYTDVIENIFRADERCEVKNLVELTHYATIFIIR